MRYWIVPRVSYYSPVSSFMCSWFGIIIFLPQKFSQKMRKFWYSLYIVRCIRGYNELYAQFREEAHQATVCSDPMNGCPGDFAEDYGRKNHRTYMELESMKIPSWIQKIASTKGEKYYEHQMAQLPWNWN